jgi:hypothetical protein
MKEGDLAASEQLISAIANKDLAQINKILERIINGRLIPDPFDEYALAREIRTLKGKLEARKDSKSWKKRGKIDRNVVARACRTALERMGEEVSEEMKPAHIANGRSGPFRRINTGEFLDRIRNKNPNKGRGR